MKLAQIHRVILGIFPCVRITRDKQAAGSAKGALFYTEADRQPNEGS